MDILFAVIYGIIEGITEWLPISSTGHMILAEQLMHFGRTPEFMTMFRVVIQLGAILAVVLLYFKKLWPFCRDNGHGQTGLAAHIKLPVLNLWCKILCASIPAAVLGFLLDDWLDAHLYNSVTVALMLILYGVFFIVIEKKPRPVTVEKLNRLTYKQAFIIGLWQVLAMIPGTSRSGATIVGALLLGISRGAAAQFTFFLAIPVMLGASGLKVIKYFKDGGTFNGMDIAVLFVGCVVAFMVSLVVIRFLMNYVKKHTFASFGWYRIVLGIIVLVVFLVQLGLGGDPAQAAGQAASAVSGA